MAAVGVKILKPGGEKMDKFEEGVSQVMVSPFRIPKCDGVLYLESPQALVELESNSDIRTTLREIFFTGAKEIDAAGKKAICINIPVPQQKTFQKIQVCIHWKPLVHLKGCGIGVTRLYLCCRSFAFVLRVYEFHFH